MKNLKEVVEIVDKIQLKPSDLILKGRNKTRSDLYFNKVLSDEFSDDNDASFYFYKSDSRHYNYKNLKHTFCKKLISMLFFIDPAKAHSDYERAYLYCSKNMFAAQILLFLQATTSGVDLCQKVFKKAIKYELTEFIINSSKYLRLHYGGRKGDIEKYEYYNTIFKQFQQVRNGEDLSEEYYIKMVLPYVNKKEVTGDVTLKGKQYYKELVPYMEKSDSPYLHFLGKYIYVIYLMSIQDYQNTITECDKAIAFFEAKPYTYKTPLRVFFHNQLICYIQLQNYAAGKRAVLRSNTLVRPGNYNWYINNELHLMLAFHAKEYQEALLIFKQAVEHPKFRALAQAIKERWLIYGAYVDFLIFIGRIPNEDSRRGRFRLGKFLNSIPTYSKDKRGMNIPILIIQILYTIVKKDYSQALDRLEAIEKYCSRYLRKDEHFRSNCFIKMLLKVPDADFHKAGVERKADKFFKQLKLVPLEFARQAYEIEIIPYEDLWEIVMESLETKFYRGRR